MHPVARVLTAAAALLLAATFVFPLWRYDLGAPQYPEGLSMTIGARGIGGQLHLVNQLNHYIGMQQIEPDAIPELRVMPWIIAGLVVSGLAVAAAGGWHALLAWCGAFVVLGLAGLADFYWWLYDYGTNLDPHAPITIEPFVPPLLGTSLLANFEVSSFPDVGGCAAFLAGLLAVAAAGSEWRRRRGGAR